nr:reverse transcriptase domain-containing protein [Tanacetum cinerariifolium]
MPVNVKAYDGTGDPDDHLKIFQAAAKIERWAMPTWCHMFNSTLIGSARIWFDKLPPESIDKYEMLRKMFLGNYSQQNKYIKDPVEIHHIKQREGESMEAFMERFKAENIINKLNDDIPKSVDKMMSVTTAFLRGKVAAANQSKKKAPPAWKHHEASHRPNFDKRLDFKSQHKSNRTQHRRVHPPKEENRRGGQVRITVAPGQRNKTMRKIRRACESRKERGNSQQRKGDNSGQETLIVIEAEVEGHLIHRMYMEGGSASKVLYEHCFNRLHLKIKNQMVSATTPLLGLSGKISWPLGKISLMVTLGDEEHSVNALMNFMVVRSSSPYNGIIGRPGLKKIQAVPTTAHGMLKFLVKGGIVMIRSTTTIPAKFRMVTKVQDMYPPKEPAVTEGVKVAIHPEYPNQTVMIGESLSEKGGMEL